MALQPQFKSPSRGYTYGKRKKASPVKFVLFAGVLLSAIGAGCFYFLRGDAKAPEVVDTPTSGQDPVATTSPTQTPVVADAQPAGDPLPEPLPAVAHKPAAAALTAIPLTATTHTTTAAASHAAAPAALTEDSAPQPLKPVVQGGATGELLAQGLRMLDAGQLNQGRAILSNLLLRGDSALARENALLVRNRLASANETLLFGRQMDAAEATFGVLESYTIKPGNSLSVIAHKYRTRSGIIQRINGITNPNRIRAGQEILVVRGPVHARVSKRDMRLDLFAKNAQGGHVFLESWPVGLGENDSTLAGTYAVGEMVENPGWTNPRTNKTWDRNDPDIPIGDHWINLTPAEEGLADTGIGIHGTNEPSSIGQMRSMGCVRLLNEDVSQVFGVLRTGHSQVIIESLN